MIALYCPSCRAQLEDIQPLDDPLHLDPDHITYDCYCKRCGWSGNISPDHALQERRI